MKVLGRVGHSDYYKVAYVIEETRRYDTLLRAVFPVCAKGTDIAVTTLRGTAGTKESDPAWKPGFHDTCEDDSLVYDFEGLAEFVYEEIPGTVFSPTTGPSSRMGTWIGCSRPAHPWITPLSGRWRRAPV